MDDWFARLLDMVEELKERPDIEVLSFSLCDPLSQPRIQSIEEALGTSLSDDLKAFFSVSNGMQLNWIHKKNHS